MKRFLVAIAFAAIHLQGQVQSINAQGSQALRIRASAVSAIDVLAQASSATRIPLKVDPGLLGTLTENRISIERDFITLEELGLLIGGETDCDITVSKERISASSWPIERRALDVARMEVARHALELAITGDASPALRSTMSFYKGRLDLASGHTDDGRRTLESFATEWADHADAPAARVLALDAAISLRDEASIRRLLVDLEARDGGVPELPNADLVTARASLALDDADGTVLRATTASRDGHTPRSRTLARVLAAEGWWIDGNFDRVVAELEALDADALAAAPDVAARIPMWIGHCLHRLNAHDSALLQVRVAARSTTTPNDKSRTARVAAGVLLKLGHPMNALLWARQGLAAKPEQDELERASVLCAELEELNGLHAEAFMTSLAVLSRATTATPEANAALSVLAKALVALERVDEARAALTTLTRKAAFRADALLRLGQLEARVGNLTAAMVALDAIDDGSTKVPTSLANAASRLRGECLMKLGNPIKAARAFEGGPEKSR